MTEKEIMHKAYLDACTNWEKARDLLYASYIPLRDAILRKSPLQDDYWEILKKQYELSKECKEVYDLLNTADSHIEVLKNQYSILREEFEVAEQKKSVLFEEWERCSDD